MPDETDPPRKNYGFKEREFKRDNRPASASQPPISTQDLAKLSGPVVRSGPVAAGTPKATDPNDVYAVLQQNRTAEHDSGGDEVVIRQIKSRRTRDYWLLLVGGNLVLAGVGLFLGGIALIFALGGVVIYSCGLTWVMWQVMGKY